LCISIEVNKLFFDKNIPSFQNSPKNPLILVHFANTVSLQFEIYAKNQCCGAGAASFGRSRSRKAMRLRLLRCCSTWVVFKKWHKFNDFSAFSMHIYYNFRYRQSEEKRMSDLVLSFTPLKIYVLLYSRVGAGAASKFSPGARAASK
jgi:hypothetical protein